MNKCKLFRNFISGNRMVILMLCVCAIGSIWEVVSVSNVYFSYETVVNVKLERPTIIELPSITFCTDIYYTITYTLFLKKFPYFKTVTKIIMCKNITDFYDRKLLDHGTFRYLVNYYYGKLTVKEQHQLTIRADEIFYWCELATAPINNKMNNSEQSSGIICSEINIIKEWTTREKKC